MNQRVEFYFLRVEFSDMKRFGRVHKRMTTSLAVEYLVRVSEVRLPRIMPRLMHELMINGADYESI
jgi:hypothetical protein